MTPDEMKSRTKQLSLRVLKLCRAMPGTTEAWEIRRQLVRCGTSVGANYRAAQRARSRAEFCAKLGTVEEEADETCFWLELIMEDGMLPTSRVQPLHTESEQICAIVSSSIRTARKNKHAPGEDRTI